MSDKDKVIKGLEWILENDRFGFGINWTPESETYDDYEQAGYNIQRAIELLKEQESEILKFIEGVAKLVAENERLKALLKEQENLAKCVDQEHRVNEYLNRQLAERPEIVRCKDCKRYYANGGACDQVLSEWFCADGKRKDGDVDD